jgi:chitin disaccharide deacetylase
MAGTATRRIWLCADDYGIAPGVNAAIRDLIARGRLNATSVMVLPPSFTRAEAEALAQLNAGGRRAAIGLHVTLTAPFRPLTPGYRPVPAFRPVGATLTAALMRRLDPQSLAAEIAAQFEAFTKVFGRAPDFVDGHQHVQLFPQVREAVLATTARLAPGAWVRQCGAATPPRLADPKGRLVDWLSRAFRARAAKAGIATNPAFAGTYSYQAGAEFAAIFPYFLQGLPDGGLIMCHPGTVDAELVRLDPLTTHREREYAFLAGEAFPATLAAHGVALA